MSQETASHQNHAQTSETGIYLPDFCGARNVVLVIIGAELLALILALAQGLGEGDFWTRLSLISLFIQWVALGSVAVLCFAREKLNEMGVRQATAIAYSIILFMTFVFSMISIWLIQFLYVPSRAGLGYSFVARNLMICAIVTALMLRYFFVQYQLKTSSEAKAKARIQALQARIRPHFLFNSMNTIASLTRSNPKEAEQAVENLADLFRMSLGNRNHISLREELDITKGYLSIEKHRLGGRLKLDWQLDDRVDLSNTIVPVLTLQPLVENALYHGIEPLTEGGTVTISVKEYTDAIEVKVSNPHSATSDQPRHKGNRMAQDNIRQRLNLQGSSLDIRTTEDKYIVSFKIKKETED